MPTLRQKRVAELIIENTILDKPLNAGQMLAKVRYSEGIQKQPSRVLKSEGVKEALQDFGFNTENAKKVVSEIMLDTKQKADSRLKATDQVFKVNKEYGEGELQRQINILVPIQVANSFNINGTDTKTIGGNTEQE